MGLAGLSLIGMVLETAGISLVIPALGALTQKNLAAKYPALEPILRRLGNPSQVRLVVIGMLTLTAVYAVKSTFLGFLAWRQMRFVNRVQSELSQRLFSGYLHQPYVFHLQRNSAQLIRNALTETDLFAGTVMVAGLTFLTEILVVLGVTALLVSIEPLGTLFVMGTLGLSSWGFNRVTQARIAKWGVARQVHEGERLQHLQQGLGGAKDVKLLGREEDFLSTFELHNLGRARVIERQGTLGQLPRLWLEFLSVAGLAALILVLIWRGRSLDALLPTLGLFAVGAFRLLPSANRLMGAVQNARYGMPAVGALYTDLSILGAHPLPVRGTPLPFNEELSLREVCFRYPASDRLVLKDINLRIPRGATVGFVGSTGSGKSTLVDVILGLLVPESGVVSVDGIDIQSNPRGWQDRIGYVPQSIFLTDDSLRRNVAFGVREKEIDDEAVRAALSLAQLDQFIGSLPNGVETRVGERGVRLSGGQRQRIGIARALYHNPAVLVLDEATSSLDTATEHEVMETVRMLEDDKTVIIVAHRLSTVEQCDRLFRIEGGRIVEAGSTAEVLANVIAAGAVPSADRSPEKQTTARLKSVQ
ncbi:MAG: ABC transporter ATP-binding protein [Gemmatimonadaceae bacterium]|nr:ABC transporter ATP-binding protein [Gemmatimonadaceae bacterium]